MDFKRLCNLFVWVCVVIPVSVLLYWNCVYLIDRDIESNINRAQVAADAEDMYEYMILARKGLEKWGIKEGHAALIFKNPMNDAALYNKAIDRIIERLEYIKKMNKSSVEYQVGIDDIRGTIRELKFNEGYHYFIHSHWLFIGIIMIVYTIFTVWFNRRELRVLFER